MSIHCWHACEHPASAVCAASFTRLRLSHVTKIAHFPHNFLEILMQFLAEMGDGGFGNFIRRVTMMFSSSQGG